MLAVTVLGFGSGSRSSRGSCRGIVVVVVVVLVVILRLKVLRLNVF